MYNKFNCITNAKHGVNTYTMHAMYLNSQNPGHYSEPSAVSCD